MPELGKAPVRERGEHGGEVLPVDVVVLVHAVQLQFEAAEQVLDHDPQVVIQDPGAETRQMLPLRLEFHQQAVQGCVHLLCLWRTEGASGTAVPLENFVFSRLKQQKSGKTNTM